MKLDKIKFARLISFIQVCTTRPFEGNELAYIDDLINIDVPSVEHVKADPVMVKALMEALRDDQKINAIKAHRSLTGYGLKESKDAVEACWQVTKPQVKSDATLGDILDTVRGPVNFDKFEG